MSKTNAIPTVYKGVQFRSRLEAKWACFFDLCGWEWAYEPVDLTGYIPDFFIFRKAVVNTHGVTTRERPIVVEVKPTRSFDSQAALKLAAAASDPQVNGSGCLLLGDGPFSVTSRYAAIGWHFRGRPSETAYHIMGDDEWPPARFLKWGDGLYRSYLSGYWTDAIGTNQLGISEEDEDVATDALDLWKRASNRVQWKGVQNDG